MLARNQFPLTTLASLLILTICLPSYSAANNELLVSLSDIKLNTNNFPKSLRGYVKTLNSDSLDKKKLNKTISELESLLEESSRGHHDEFYFLLGVANELVSNLKAAQSSYKESLKRRANRVSPVVRLGVLAQKNKNYQLAIDYFNDAKWQLTSLDPDILNLLAECFLSLGRSQKANALLAEARVLRPDAKPNSRLLLNSALDKLRANTDPAQTVILETKVFGHLKTLIDSGETDPSTLKLFSEYTLKTADPLIDSAEFDRLESLLELNLKRSKHSEEIVESYVNTLILRRKLNRASKVLEKGLAVDPGSAKLNELKRQLQIELGSS